VGRQERIAELSDLRPPESGRTLEIADLATGYGRTARAILAAAEGPVRIHAVDTGPIIDDDLLHDPRVRPVLADLDEPLPFPDSTLDRVTSVNVAEHLADPRAHLAECYRLLRPGGLLVLMHSDWDTTLVSSDDDVLTRQLVDRFVATVPKWAARADGFMGRKLLGLATAAPFEVVTVDTWADCHRRFDENSVAWKVARGVLAAAADDPQLAPKAATWAQGLRQYADEGRFLFSVTDVVVVLRRPLEPAA
jgi:SAM-dependent methyltransferase